MILRFGFGHGFQEVDLPEGNLLQELHAATPPGGLGGVDGARQALSQPIGTPPLRQIARPGEKVAIISSDITRPMPTAQVMPLILDELYAAGVRKEDITLVLGLGIHRPHSEAERRHLAGERAWREITVVDSDPKRVTRLGITQRGTPVDIDTRVAEADRRVCLGNIEYHYFAGYSGGGKAIMPGVSTAAAIENNHRMMVHEQAHAGNLAGNPIREDIEEAAALVGIDFILNVVLDEEKQIVHAVAGDAVQAHRAGCAFLDRMYAVEVPQLADIVLVSQGGAPKDLNLYQTQKALDNARHAVRGGGIIILIGSCREGYGEAAFERWARESDIPTQLINRVHERFELGGHKAAAIAMVLEKAQVFLVSEMTDDQAREIFLQPYPSAQAALDAAFGQLGPHARVIAMPHGGSTLPRPTGEARG